MPRTVCKCSAIKTVVITVCLPMMLNAMIAHAADEDSQATAAKTIQACQHQFEPAGGSYDFVEGRKADLTIPDDATIGNIHITRLPIFDEKNPRENNAIYRFANRVHIMTKEHVVERALLFEDGQAFDERVMQETARLLRDERHLYDAAVRPVAVCGDQVDIEVITKDVWSFTPDLSLSRSGGENTHRIAIRETNLLGRAQEIGLVFKKDLDRESSVLSYRNRNIHGSRIGTRLEFADSDDGEEQDIALVLPFYALDSRRAWGVRASKLEQVDAQFFRGEEVTEVTSNTEDFWAFRGFSNGLVDGVAKRWNFGYRYHKENYSLGPDLPPPTRFPLDRTLSYPFVEFAAVQDNYTTSFNLNQIHRTEDLHLGYSYWVRLGAAAEAFGSDESRLVVAGEFEDTIFYNEDMLWLHNFSFRGMWNTERSDTEDVLFEYNTRYFRNQTAHRSFFANFNLVYSNNLTSNEQVVFGGETGARAFSNRFQAGDRRWVLTLEERFYSDMHWLNLVRPGWALFFDAGRAWQPSVDDGLEDDVLMNLGLGIRLASTKADDGRIIHIDFAFPLTNRNDINVSGTEISITIKDEL